MPNRRRAQTLRAAFTLALVTICVPVSASGTEDAQPCDLATLEAQFSEAHVSKDYAKALEVAERMRDLIEEKRIDVLYDIAAMHCLLGHEEEAYECLERTFAAGFRDFRRLMTDADFACISDQARFKKMARSRWLQQYIDMLEREEREEFQKPAEVMSALAFKPGERVADIGAGSGYFTIPVAKAVGPEGTVWAIDIRQEMLDHIEGRLEKENLDNVQLKLVPEDDPQLPAGGVDTILMVDTIHYIQERTAYAKKLRAGLAPGGRLVIIDYRPKPWEERPWGPLPEQQIPRETLDAELAAAGLRPVKVHEFLPEQYFVIYRAE